MKAIWLLRVASFCLLVFIAMKPVVVRPESRLLSNWAVLLDTSHSMLVKDPASRFDQATTLVTTLRKAFPNFKLYAFDDGIREVQAKDLETIKPVGDKSNIAEALTALFQKQEARGAIVLTDGRHVGPGDPVQQAAQIGKPLLLVGFGNKTLFKDISVRQIQSPPFAFKNVLTTLSAVISISGYQGKTISVKLKQGERILSLQTVQATEDVVEANVTFGWMPTSLGTKVLTVEADQFEGEFTTKNNRKQISLDVGRDRFRVLYICGKPGPEYGFLRHQFKSDPAVELVTFVILRNALNIVNVPDSELSLIPFPTQDVLISQMATFDLIVFEEFSYQQFGLPPQVLYAIRKRVEEGGSFLLMGGELMLGQMSPYAIPGIEEMIPLTITRAPVQTVPGPLPFRVRAPEHPILRIVPNSEQNLKLWAGLPGLEEVTLAPGVKSGATVLGTVNYEGRDYPVLTVWQSGKGRVGVLTSRTTWRFSMIDGNIDQTAIVYPQFWKNMVLWLTSSDQFKTVRIAVEKNKISLGEEKPVRVWVYDNYFKPISDVDVQIQITDAAGESQSLKSIQETKGVFYVPFRPAKMGNYIAKTWVTREGKRYGSDTVTFQVSEAYSEDEDLRPDFDQLKELARATGGQFVNADQFTLDAFEEFNQELKQTSGRKILLWNSPWFLLALLTFLMVEWFLRKRKGLP